MNICLAVKGVKTTKGDGVRFNMFDGVNFNTIRGNNGVNAEPSLTSITAMAAAVPPHLHGSYGSLKHIKSNISELYNLSSSMSLNFKKMFKSQ